MTDEQRGPGWRGTAPEGTHVLNDAYAQRIARQAVTDDTPRDPLAAAIHEIEDGDNPMLLRAGPSLKQQRLAARLREAGVLTKAEVVAAVEGLRMRQPNMDDIESMVLVDRANGVLDRVLATLDTPSSAKHNHGTVWPACSACGTSAPDPNFPDHELVDKVDAEFH